MSEQYIDKQSTNLAWTLNLIFHNAEQHKTMKFNWQAENNVEKKDFDRDFLIEQIDFVIANWLCWSKFKYF